MKRKVKGIVDRFEGDIAVVEIDKKTLDLPKTIFPKEIDVGDVVIIEVMIDKKETEKLRKEIEELMNEVFED
ncbi:DUF3006 domain-containing protein [Geobacillus thermoleovorans]|uniref:DUF3006 domain-containing protein n=1 Tax=Geobacillus thermoleovorans TaxID=33941 RepID=UPI0009BD1B60|nr:DUF3006 domain-containing protein [Geobacillus thermoleovorans]OQP12611.1 pyruvate kinase [Geobacillus thermoleovorans]QNU22930.1 DUF3006 domain-containing protein [Geobacillus thermoleovorans]